MTTDPHPLPVLVPLPDLASYVGLATEIEQAMGSLTITSEVERSVAAEWLARAKEAVKTLHAKRREALKPLESDRDIINATFAAVSSPFERAETALGQRIGEWTVTEQRRVAEENRLAEQERLRAQAEAERLAADARRLAGEAEQARAVAAAPARAETLEEFFKAEDLAEAAAPETVKTEAALADARLAAGRAALAAVPQPPKVAPSKTVETSRGTITTPMVWTWELDPEKTEEEALALVPREYLMLSPGTITRAVKNGVRSILGIRIFQKGTAALREKPR